jgi:hypothetical protein
LGAESEVNYEAAWYKNSGFEYTFPLSSQHSVVVN